MKKQKAKLMPNIIIEKPLEKIHRYAAALISAIKTNDETLINNNINLLRMELEKYDIERFGSKELPF